MKHILITGKDSYIGTSVKKYLEKWPKQYKVDELDVRDDEWKKYDFSKYDVVYHVAGIAHVDVKKADEETKKLYYRVNCDLAEEVAKVAKKAGVKQFIFMSSAIVYGDSAPVGKQRLITRDTQPNPADFYGDSKLQAEKGILPLGDEKFKVCILRPPMIYGKGSRGNYPTLSKMAQKLPIFPLVDNCRSMLYIGNLVEFVRLMIKNEEEGFFFPQNAQYSNTSRLVQMIAAAHGKKILLVKDCTPPLRLLSHATGIVNKAFGSLAYDMAMSEYKEEYRKFSLEESIRLTEG